MIRSAPIARSSVWTAPTTAPIRTVIDAGQRVPDWDQDMRLAGHHLSPLLRGYDA
ncbi:hypothetical protein [Phenylobacterium sp. 58.2.17]|uniref:hypothetical protein n=1 Tax=Phenylobacterium sp. 58.2.17 TaxID=2969306 RepID=UPI002264244B|nr:hypothetical protein [Phenylobacterium sp. 58.2.17]MCX7587122.1 hypothetical protein [Phenylobacterium sp. 58.2.17]